MANYSTLISDITAKIYENAANDITGQDLQDVLLEMVQEMGQSGMVCLGIADGNTNPPSGSDGNIFYIAGEGTYSNFGGLTVNAGEIALFIWDGATWTKQSVTTTDPNKADKVAGATAGDLAGLDGSGNLTDSGVPSNNVAQQDGYYSTLTAGSAENLIGRGTVPAEYTRRTSGGSADIGSGAAAIEKIHGNTIAWNQITQNGDTELSNSTTDPRTHSPIYFKASSNVATPFWADQTGRISFVVTSPADSGGATVFISGQNGDISLYTVGAVRQGHKYFIAYTCTAADISTVGGYKYKNRICVDLTLAFGAGNEPSSAAEFESLFPLNYYAYNTGSLVSLTGTGIETNGFNQWDEEWRNGYYGEYTGTYISSPNYICTTNPVPIFGNTTYFLHCPSGRIYISYYDSEGNLINTATWVVVYDGNTFTTPANAASMNFWVIAAYGTVYKGDICINLSWSGYRNGEYEAYWDSTLALPITSVTSGGSAVFADGMKGAMAAYDELTSTKAVKRIEKVNLGSLSWTYDSANQQFISADIVGTIEEPAAPADMPNAICSKYITVNYAGLSGDKCLNVIFASSSAHGKIYIRDSAYSDAPTFTTAMNGVYMYYALKTPTEYTLDSELNLNYRVDDFGTETLLPQNNATPTTAPIIYDVRYAMNAVDTLRNLPKNYISKDSMEHILNAMVTAGVISAYTLTWNATNENYDCTITA